MSEVNVNEALSNLDDVIIDIDLINEVFHDKKQNHVDAYKEGMKILKLCENHFLSENLSNTTRIKFLKQQSDIMSVLCDFKLSDKIEIYKENLPIRLKFIKTIKNAELEEDEEKIVKEIVLFNKESFLKMLTLIKKSDEEELDFEEWNYKYLTFAPELDLTKKEIKDFAFTHNIKYLLIGENKVKILN